MIVHDYTIGPKQAVVAHIGALSAGRDERDSREWSKKRRAELLDELERLLKSSNVDTTLLADAVDEYKIERVHEGRLKTSTIEQYTDALGLFVGALGDECLCDLTRGHVSQFIDTCSPGRRSSIFATVSACLNWLEKNNHPGCADLIPLRRPKSRRKERYLDDAELGLFWVGIARAEARGIVRRRTADAIRICVFVPLRAGECCSLQWSEIDVVASCIRLRDTKTGDRVVPLPPVAAEIIDRQPRRSSYVFPGNMDRGCMRRGSLSHAYKKIVRFIGRGLEETTLHCLRHSWASKAIRDGVKPDYVREILGHTTQWMTARYVHASDRDLHEAVRQIEASILERGEDDA